MGRAPRAGEGGLICRALDRANGRLTILDDEGGYGALVRALTEAVARDHMRLPAWEHAAAPAARRPRAAVRDGGPPGLGSTLRPRGRPGNAGKVS
jgi:hypothetical protein